MSKQMTVIEFLRLLEKTVANRKWELTATGMIRCGKACPITKVERPNRPRSLADTDCAGAALGLSMDAIDIIVTAADANFDSLNFRRRIRDRLLKICGLEDF
jgi:hypothetical protein